MQHPPKSLMLFAAGLGTRMGALVADRPKPLIEVAGRALIDHALDLSDGAGIGEVVVNLHYRGDMIRSHLSHRPDIRFSPETDLLLETGGGLRAALPLLGEGPVLTLNSDAVWTGPNPLSRLLAAWDPRRMDALLLLVPRGRATGHLGAGDFDLDGAGRLTRGRDTVYAGAQIVKTDALPAIEDRVFSLNRLWDAFARKGRLFGALHQGGWCDVGRPESIPLAEALLRAASHV